MRAASVSSWATAQSTAALGSRRSSADRALSWLLTTWLTLGLPRTAGGHRICSRPSIPRGCTRCASFGDMRDQTIRGRRGGTRRRVTPICRLYSFPRTGLGIKTGAVVATRPPVQDEKTERHNQNEGDQGSLN